MNAGAAERLASVLSSSVFLHKSMFITFFQFVPDQLVWIVSKAEVRSRNRTVSSATAKRKFDR